MFDLLGHPSIMQWEDPKFQAYELVCDMVANPAARRRSSASTRLPSVFGSGRRRLSFDRVWSNN